MQEFTEYPELVPHLRAITAALSLNSPKVIYPCSGEDITPAYMWGSKNITFLDIEPKRITKLQALGLDARVADAETTAPFGEFDIIYAHNTPKLCRCLEMLVKKGYVIGNGMYNLKKLLGNSYVLLGATQTENGKAFFNKDTRDFYEEAETWEDYQNCILRPELKRAIHSIIKETGLPEQDIFNFLKTQNFPIYKKYGGLYVFQKI